ncbi:EmrB/QacA subfamily drug resistance transporter [Caulobacter ginsengisoli]|uniref:EmrB/QacA subfamily drug resistance transporter n=1 Tax=Caulobacter ginsengisoli TaxID=400775 RepID=A0ABU0INS9_9CAUL|nr:MFS transporter [Caulobacter ginsengisoli]MDQ0463662.1 EmrB/QacA subfamily drug resistance transporter [Caulobacter ginsengisoli]
MPSEDRLDSAPQTPLPDAPPAVSSWASRLVALAVASALLMEFIDSTALSTALPTLARGFHVDPIHLKLALTSYILALAVFVPVSGWAAEKFGARRVFLAAMAVFLIGSALCGLSRTLTELVGARIIQGMGGAMMTPVARLIVVGQAPREQLLRAMGWFVMPALIGPLIGPPLAGFVLSVADWPWIFYLNLPVGLLGMVAVMRFVPPIKSPDPGPFDWLGFFLAASAISGIVAVAETGGLSIIPPVWQAVLVAASLAAAFAYVRFSRRKARPILDLGLLRYKTLRASLVGGTFVRLGIGAGPFLMPLLLQVGMGWTPLQAGSVTLAGGLGVLGARPFAGAILKRVGFRTALCVFLVVSSVMIAAPAAFRIGTPAPLIMGLLLFGGFFRSSQFIAANTIAYADVPDRSVAAASTLSAVTQQVGLALGISFGGLMLHFARGGADGALTPDRFTLPYIAIGAVTLMALPFYLGLDKDAGANLSGHKGATSAGAEKI